MPELFRFFGYSFFFYSREHEPMHIHVEGNGGYAVFDHIETGFVLREMRGIKAKDLKKIQMAIDENREIIITTWEEHFEKQI